MANGKTYKRQYDLQPAQSAKAAGLRYVSDGALPGLSRRRAGAAFRYIAPGGNVVRERATLKRIGGTTFALTLEAVFFQSNQEKCMNTRLLGAAVAAALLGLSTASFGQASGQDTPREAGTAKASPGSAESGATGSTGGSAATGSATTGSTVTTSCDTLTGSAKARCLRDQSSSSGSSSSAPAGSVTKLPDQSGPGTSDKTEPRGKAGVGTSSAGSN